VPEDKSALRFHHRYLPAAAVSGDFFNVLAISDTLAGVFICDVMGHGLRAALVTAIMRGLIEELMPIAAEPGRLLTELNRSLLAILQRTDEPLLATAFYMVTDVEQDTVEFASAGHPSPLRVMPATGQVERLRTYDSRHGPALGLFEKSIYPTCRCPIAAKDRFLLFTDGLYEIEGPGHEEYGQDRLLAAVRQRPHLPAPALFEALLADTQQYSEAKEFEDDVCLLAMEVTWLGETPHI
jgi:serine phosphatase RsbU (regulator of sigma subunit)